MCVCVRSLKPSAVTTLLPSHRKECQANPGTLEECQLHAWHWPWKWGSGGEKSGSSGVEKPGQLPWPEPEPPAGGRLRVGQKA